MAGSSEKTQAIMGNEKSEIFKIIKKIQELSLIIGNEDLIRQNQNVKDDIRQLGYILLAKIQPFAKKEKQLNNFLNQITGQKADFSQNDSGNFNNYMAEQLQAYKIENLITFISELDYPMPEAVRLSVNSVGKELDSLKRMIELEWGADIFDKEKSPLRHLIKSSVDVVNFQYLVMNAVSAKGPYIDFKDNGEPSMYVDGGAGGADISIVTPEGLIAVGAATMKTKGSLEALSYETDQVVRHYAMEQFVYDNMKDVLKDYALALKTGDELPSISTPRKSIVSEKAKLSGLNAQTKRFHYEVMKSVDWSDEKRGDMYYLPEIDEKTLADTEILDIKVLLYTMASSVVSGISAYSKFYTENKHVLKAVSSKLKTIITTDDQLIIDQNQLNEALSVLSKKIDKNLFNYKSEGELLESLDGTEDPHLNVNYLMYKSMHKDIAETGLQRTDTAGLVLLSLAMMAEQHPESLDLQKINFQNLASTNRDIHDVLENCKSKQRDKLRESKDADMKREKDDSDARADEATFKVIKMAIKYNDLEAAMMEGDIKLIDLATYIRNEIDKLQAQGMDPDYQDVILSDVAIEKLNVYLKTQDKTDEVQELMAVIETYSKVSKQSKESVNTQDNGSGRTHPRR